MPRPLVARAAALDAADALLSEHGFAAFTLEALWLIETLGGRFRLPENTRAAALTAIAAAKPSTGTAP